MCIQVIVCWCVCVLFMRFHSEKISAMYPWILAHKLYCVSVCVQVLFVNELARSDSCIYVCCTHTSVKVIVYLQAYLHAFQCISSCATRTLAKFDPSIAHIFHVETSRHLVCFVYFTDRSNVTPRCTQIHSKSCYGFKSEAIKSAQWRLLFETVVFFAGLAITTPRYSVVQNTSHYGLESEEDTATSFHRKGLRESTPSARFPILNLLRSGFAFQE